MHLFVLAGLAFLIVAVIISLLVTSGLTSYLVSQYKKRTLLPLLARIFLAFTLSWTLYVAYKFGDKNGYFFYVLLAIQLIGVSIFISPRVFTTKEKFERLIEGNSQLKRELGTIVFLFASISALFWVGRNWYISFFFNPNKVFEFQSNLENYLITMFSFIAIASLARFLISIILFKLPHATKDFALATLPYIVTGGVFVYLVDLRTYYEYLHQ
ncbi:hypothetical protein J3998_07875 [Thiomicrorhabdus sp. 6S2-11]|uniref:Uncharacterized protein n=1 Tax=Thiomicrorhabdus marina TaxID=2818442 RepID=A0ABS3Q586_9GAMM|nr:hypothetical protein [Thiomicrorhabdus marina]MBO1927494.1 hypothetical protein [Thiomicrorhabdus marina]